MARVAVDTNILARLLAGDKLIARALKGHSLLVSIVTDIELHAYSGYTVADERKVASLLKDCDVMGVSDKVRTGAIFFRKAHRLDLAAALIAATAQAFRIPLFTGDNAFNRCKDAIDVRYFKL